MTNRENIRAIAERWMIEVWKFRNLENFDEIHLPHFIDFSSGGRDSDRDGYRQSIAELFAAFPDWEAEIEDIIIDESQNKAAIRWTAAGKHEKEFIGFAPTGKLIEFRGIEIIKVENDGIAARWGEWDGIDLSEQLKEKSL